MATVILCKEDKKEQTYIKKEKTKQVLFFFSRKKNNNQRWTHENFRRKIFLERINPMDTCGICYETPIHFFYLACCRHNKICFPCLEKLISPKCPFCRHALPHPTTTPKKKRRQQPMDDPFMPSRTRRRQLRRLWKLELREYDQAINRIRSYSI